MNGVCAQGIYVTYIIRLLKSMNLVLEPLVRELAHEMQLKVRVPYGAWFDKGQVCINSFVCFLRADEYIRT